MANEFIARKGLIVLGNGAEVTGSSKFSANVTASGNIKATAFYGDGANVTGVVTSSYATTSSLATDGIITASGAGSTITFTKGDGSTFPVTITVGSSATASYVEYNNVANKPELVSASSQIDHNSTTNYVANQHIDHSTVSMSAGAGLSGGGDITTSRTLTLDTGSAHFTGGVKTKLNTDGVVSSSAQVSYTGLSNVPSGIVSSSTQFTTLSDPFTGSFTGSFTGDGSGLSGIATTLTISGSSGGSDGINLKTDTLIFEGNNGVTTTVSDNKLTIAIPAGTVSSSGQVSYTGLSNVPAGIVSSSGQVDHDLTTNFVANEHIDHSTVSITAGSGLTGGGNITATRTLTLDTGSAHFTDGVKAKLNTDGVISSSAQVQYGSISNVPAGIVSSSGQVSYTGLSNIPAGIVSSSDQVDVRNTTGIATIATTGSNSFTGVQTITSTTNSTTYADGALIVYGGVGIGKDVNISGSLNVTGLLTVASMSTQYVTSSQYTVGTSRVVLNDDDLVRFAGLTVVDSGSTGGSGSLLWDSFNNRWVYEAYDTSYNSAVLIAGPKNFGSLGNESGLVAGRIPVATGDDHIDTSAASSSIYIDFSDLKTYIESGLYVTGSISSSVGFWGDGSNLTGVVSTLAVTGSDGVSTTTGTVNLKTQAITYSAGEGIDISVSGQTVSIAGEDATTTNKGIASFNTTNFDVVSGAVSSKNITINGTGVTLGGTRNITLAQITTQGATTTDQVTLGGGAIVHGVLFTSSSATSLADGNNQVVASIATGSYDSAMFDYVIKDGTNFRAGTVTSVWQSGTANIEFTDTSTNDIGSTLNQSFAVDTSSGNVRLKFSTSGGGTWTVKTAIRLL